MPNLNIIVVKCLVSKQIVKKKKKTIFQAFVICGILIDPDHINYYMTKSTLPVCHNFQDHSKAWNTPVFWIWVYKL